MFIPVFFLKTYIHVPSFHVNQGIYYTLQSNIVFSDSVYVANNFTQLTLKLLLRSAYGWEVLWSACMSVCLSACSHISKTTRSNFTKFSTNVTCDSGLILLRRQCGMLCTSGFADDVMFSHSLIEQMTESSCTPGGGTSCTSFWRYVWSRSTDGGTGA